MLACLAILTLWTGIGVLVTVGLIVTEVIMSHKHPDRFLETGRRLGPDDKPISLGNMLAGLVLWPGRAKLLWDAYKNGRSPLEQVAVEAEQKKLQAQEALTRVLKFFQGKEALGVQWRTFPVPGSDVILHARLALYLASGSGKPEPRPVCTHFVTVDSDQILVYWRGDPEGIFVPWGVGRTLEDAKGECDNDTQWLDLCLPGKEGEKRTLLETLRGSGPDDAIRNMIERMHLKETP